MGKIYTTQDLLRISLTFTADIAGDISDVKIKYKDPNGLTGEWDATLTGSTKTIHYDLPQGTFLDVTGRWHFWAYATMTDGTVIPGEAVSEYIYNEGQ